MSYAPIDDLRPGEEDGGAAAAAAAVQSQATITVDAGSDGTTARPTGWGHVHWLKDNGVTLDNVDPADTVDEREA